MEPLALLDAALRGALVVLLALLGLGLLRNRSRGAGHWLGALLTLGLMLQAIASAPWVEATLPRLWQAPLVAISVGNAVLFWLFARALFDDEFRPRRWHGLLWLAVLGLSGLNCAWLAPMTGQWALADASFAVQRWLPVLFGLLVAWAVLRHWRNDLVERRRRVRAFIAIAGCLYMVVMVGVRLRSPAGRLSTLGAGFDMAALLAIMSALAWRLVRLPGAEALFEPPQPLASKAASVDDGTDEAFAQTLLRQMDEQHYYRDEALSVARLAQHLQLPEYRLRRLINQHLGQRNFSSFVNGFRLGEAKRALADPARRATPVLSIALDAGFASIGPFNRAFKADTGLTPSEFRRQSLADS